MPADLANWGAAQAAGWQRTRAQAADGTYVTVMELAIGQDRQSGHAIRITGHHASQGQADKNALDSVNAWRRNRYGYDAAADSKGPRSGNPLTVDQM